MTVSPVTRKDPFIREYKAIHRDFMSGLILGAGLGAWAVWELSKIQVRITHVAIPFRVFVFLITVIAATAFTTVSGCLSRRIKCFMRDSD